MTSTFTDDGLVLQYRSNHPMKCECSSVQRQSYIWIELKSGNGNPIPLGIWCLC